MEVTEVATRMVRRYWLVLLTALLVPVIAAGAYVSRQPASYTAHARIVAGERTPTSAAEASAIASQVQAVVTSRDLVIKAIATAKVRRDPDNVIAATTVTGLGSSTLVDIGYTDRDAAVAQRLTASLADAAVTQLDAIRIGGLPQALSAIDNQLSDLATKRAPLAAAAQANPKDLVAQNRLAGIDRLISDLTGSRDQLAESEAAAGHSTVVAAPVRPAAANSRGLAARLGIAGLFGLVLGLLIVGLREMLRPTVSTAGHVARLLDVPVLGTLSPDPAILAGIGRRIRLAALRARVSTVVLGHAGPGPLPPELVDRIEAAALRPAPVPPRAGIPIDVNGHPAAVLVDVAELDGAEVGHDGRPADQQRDAGRLDAARRDSPIGVVLVRARDNEPPVRTQPSAAVAAQGQPRRLHRVCALDELDPAVEQDHIGLVVLAEANTRLSAVGEVRDLMAASGWPLLGVLGHRGRGRR